MEIKYYRLVMGIQDVNNTKIPQDPTKILNQVREDLKKLESNFNTSIEKKLLNGSSIGNYLHRIKSIWDDFETIYSNQKGKKGKISPNITNLKNELQRLYSHIYKIYQHNAHIQFMHETPKDIDWRSLEGRALKVIIDNEKYAITTSTTKTTATKKK